MSRPLSRERVARKRHICGHCLRPIQPGERYIDSRLPPHSELGNHGWWREACHLPGTHWPAPTP